MRSVFGQGILAVLFCFALVGTPVTAAPLAGADPQEAESAASNGPTFVAAGSESTVSDEAASEEPESEEMVLARELYNAVSPTTAEDMLEGFRFGMGEAADQLPAEFWEALIARFDTDEVESILAPVYAEHLTVEEMREALVFFRSPTGKKLAAQQAEIALESMAKVEAWMMPILQELFIEFEDSLAAVGETQDADSLGYKTSMKQTVADLRNVGTAMMAWLTDQISPKDGVAVTLEDGEPEAWSIETKAGDVRLFRRVRHEQVEALLVPHYIAEVPVADAWGNEYEFAINADYLGTAVLCIRSAGSDGRFEESTYAMGPFPIDESGHDIVWTDGYFARWPQSDSE